MTTIPLHCNESFLRRLTELTRDGGTSQAIADRMQQEEVIPGWRFKSLTIAKTWNYFGGREAFVAEMDKRRDCGKPLANPVPVSKIAEKKTRADLLDDARLRRLARAGRSTLWAHAIAAVCSDMNVSVSQVDTFIRKKFRNKVAFFEHYAQ